MATFRALHAAIAGDLVRACHDPSEGGLAVALAEMALGGGRGAELDLAKVPSTFASAGKPDDPTIAFSESLSRFIVEVTPQDAAAFEACFAALPWARAGRVTADDSLRLFGLDGQPFVEATLAEVEHAWRGHLA
jgi:phosphoribosylformylglycinamidine synthase